MWWPKVGAALQSCHHANDQLPAFALRLLRRAGWRADLLLAEETHIREGLPTFGRRIENFARLVTACSSRPYNGITRCKQAS
jgi:hypothetical protein